LSLPRNGAGSAGTVYRTADGQFEMRISNLPTQRRDELGVAVSLFRIYPDPSPSDFQSRDVRNGFTISYHFDRSRYEVADDMPLLRAALLSVLDSTLQGRVLAGEK
jgi:hypothetical protein